MISIQIYPTISELLEHLAPATVELANSAVEEEGLFTFALAGGATPESFYRLLSGGVWKKRFPWKKTLFFWGDERAVAPDDPESNFCKARQVMFSRVSVPEDHIIRMRGEESDLNRSAADYEAKIKTLLQKRRTKFDLILLGMGEDGHTASLFPGSPGESEREKLVMANPIAQLKTTRLTFTFPLINQARSVFLLVTGMHKSEVIKKTFLHRSQYPVHKIQPREGQLTWWMDRASAADLSKKDIEEYMEWYQKESSKAT